MNTTETKSYAFSFDSTETPQRLFETLLDVRQWWVGLHGEVIKGNSEKPSDEFTFHAGNGVHYSKQRLIEVVPNKKIVWQITESNLTFAQKTDEWTNTTLCFDITTHGNKSKVTFTHQGLVPQFECYDGCSGAWTQYLENLAEKVK